MTSKEKPPTPPSGDLPPLAPPPEVPRGFVARVRNYFLTGLIVAGPVAITAYLTWWFVTWGAEEEAQSLRIQGIG